MYPLSSICFTSQNCYFIPPQGEDWYSVLVMFLAEVGMIWEQRRKSNQSKVWISAEPYKPHRRDKFLVLWELYQVICNEQCSLNMSDNYIIRYQNSPKVNYYSDFDFHLKSFNPFINDAKLPTNRNKYFEDHMDPISFHLCAAWMTLTPFSHRRLTDAFRCALPEVVGGAS